MKVQKIIFARAIKPPFAMPITRQDMQHVSKLYRRQHDRLRFIAGCSPTKGCFINIFHELDYTPMAVEPKQIAIAVRKAILFFAQKLNMHGYRLESKQEYFTTQGFVSLYQLVFKKYNKEMDMFMH